MFTMTEVFDGIEIEAVVTLTPEQQKMLSKFQTEGVRFYPTMQIERHLDGTYHIFIGAELWEKEDAERHTSE